MRLANIATMSLPPGRVRSLIMDAAIDRSQPLPVSFDQRRHVGEGSRPGSWLAIAFPLPASATDERIEAAWIGAIERHGSMRTAFRIDDGDLVLERIVIGDRRWVEHPADGRSTRAVVRSVLDAACAPFEVPSHRIVLVDPDTAIATDTSPVLVIGSDHALTDMWSLVLLARDLLTGIEDAAAGRRIGETLPPVAEFAEHTEALARIGEVPAAVRTRWDDLLNAGDGLMPRFPLDLGALDGVVGEVVEVRDVVDADGVARLEAAAASVGERLITVAISALTEATVEIADGAPLRAVFPVHSRSEPKWRESVGWFITNSVIESNDPDLRACGAAIAEAIRLGSQPLAPVFADHGGRQPATPGMLAVSWLDDRRLPVRLPPVVERSAQYVSAVIHADGVMIWFVVNGSGLHLRCRYPDTPQAKRSCRAWLDAIQASLRSRAEAI
jgi:hypothetical protein